MCACAQWGTGRSEGEWGNTQVKGMLATTPPPSMTPHEPSPCCCLPLNYTFLQFFPFPLHLLLVRLLPRPLCLRAVAAVSLSLLSLIYIFLLIFCVCFSCPPNMLLRVLSLLISYCFRHLLLLLFMFLSFLFFLSKVSWYCSVLMLMWLAIVCMWYITCCW